MNTFSDAINKHNLTDENKTDRIQLSQFVDDCGNWTESGKAKNAIRKMQKALNTVEAWSKKYGFQINPNKAQVVLFQNRRKNQ